MKQAVSRLIDVGILYPTAKTEEMDDRHLGTVLTLSLVMDRLEKGVEGTIPAFSGASGAAPRGGPQ